MRHKTVTFPSGVTVITDRRFHAATRLLGMRLRQHAIDADVRRTSYINTSIFFSGALKDTIGNLFGGWGNGVSLSHLYNDRYAAGLDKLNVLTALNALR